MSRCRELKQLNWCRGWIPTKTDERIFSEVSISNVDNRLLTNKWCPQVNFLSSFWRISKSSDENRRFWNGQNASLVWCVKFIHNCQSSRRYFNNSCRKSWSFKRIARLSKYKFYSLICRALKFLFNVVPNPISGNSCCLLKCSCWQVWNLYKVKIKNYSWNK